jgi:hypothetical protein
VVYSGLQTLFENMNALNSNLSLTQSNGETLRVSDCRQKENLVILLTDETNFRLLSRLVNDLSEPYAEFRAEETEILVVVGRFGHSPEKVGAGLPLSSSHVSKKWS